MPIIISCGLTKFLRFFPVISDPQGVYFPKILEALNVESRLIEEFTYEIENERRILIPRLENFKGDERRGFPLLSRGPQASVFSFLQGIQGQFFDRTSEDQLRQGKELLLEKQLKSQDIIKQIEQAPQRNFQTAGQLFVTASL